MALKMKDIRVALSINPRSLKYFLGRHLTCYFRAAAHFKFSNTIYFNLQRRRKVLKAPRVPLLWKKTGRRNEEVRIMPP